MNFSKLLLLIIILILFFPFLGLGEGRISVAPAIISQKASAKDLLEFSLEITNSTSFKVELYPIVNDISVKEGKQEFLEPSLLKKSTSLARWVRISRGRIELWPGESRELPFSVHVDRNAKPGEYYALITFAQGSTRIEAEKRALKLSQPQVLLNIEIEEHVVERAQIQKFQTEKNFFLNFPVKFLLEIKNIGNREIKPKGFIIIYNRRGEEVGEININQQLASVMPLNAKFFENNWHPQGGFGQYKAQLMVEYGNNEILQDIAYFWVLPWQFLVLFCGGFLVLAIISLYLIFLKIKKHYSQPPFQNKVVDLRQ